MCRTKENSDVADSDSRTTKGYEEVLENERDLREGKKTENISSLIRKGEGG